MKETLSESVIVRLDRLERVSQRWRLCSFATLAVLTLLGLVGAQADRTPQKIKANEIVIVDADGNPRITLTVSEGGPVISFSPKDGPPRLYMGLGGGPEPNSQPFLNFRAKSGLPILLMGLSSDIEDGVERPHFTINDQRARARFAWGLSLDDQPYFGISDKQRQTRLAFGLDPRDETYFKLFDGKGREISNHFEKTPAPNASPPKSQ